MGGLSRHFSVFAGSGFAELEKMNNYLKIEVRFGRVGLTGKMNRCLRREKSLIGSLCFHFFHFSQLCKI
jgi:hypothetical protein